MNRILTYGFIGFSLLFLFSLDYRPYPFSWAVKTIPIVCLAIFAFASLQAGTGRLMGIGFLFSGLGDILLELPGNGLFEAGMAAFILAHCLYTALFIRRPRLTRPRGVLAGGLASACLAFGVFLFPFLGDMAVPIYVYLGVILCMGISACLGRDNHWFVILGAVLFILSDSMIAYTRFVAPLAHSSFWVMLTYYGGQAMLAAGAYRSRPADSPG